MGLHFLKSSSLIIITVLFQIPREKTSPISDNPANDIVSSLRLREIAIATIATKATINTRVRYNNFGLNSNPIIMPIGTKYVRARMGKNLVPGFI